jgi:hypothetical protein
MYSIPVLTFRISRYTCTILQTDMTGIYHMIRVYSTHRMTDLLVGVGM